MKADVRRIDDVVVLDLDGDLVAGVGDEVLHAAVDELLAAGWRKIVINLARVRRMDSSGIGELVAGWKLARRVGAFVRLLRPNDRVHHTLAVSQILPLLDVDDDEAAALAALRLAAPAS